VTGSDGPKLNRTKAITGVDVTVAPDHIDVTGVSLPAFVGMLASWTGQPVTDETKIQGSYDFRLNVTMADLKSASPAVLAAIRSLGLSLEARAIETKYLVIDHAEN
jgi:uncharacterized protein (TIGR03435 family)